MPTAQTDLISRILERGKTIQMMAAHKLELDFLHEFSIPELTACCDRMAASLPDISITDKVLTRQLIQNEPFSEYLADLLLLIPEEEPENSGERPSKPIIRSSFWRGLSSLVQACQNCKRDITVYPKKDLMECLSVDFPVPELCLVFLEQFAPMKLDKLSRQTVTDNLSHCVEVPLELDEKQRNLLLEPFVSSRFLFTTAPFGEICGLLTTCPALLDIIRLLHERQVEEYLGLTEYKTLAQAPSECCGLLRSLTGQMDEKAVASFFTFWQKGGCTINELKSLERWITTHPGQDWSSLFATYSGYINLLYGARFKKIDLSAMTGAREDILIYAIIQNKKHFIRLVDEHTETFLSLSSNSILFWDDFYKEHFNLNELTERDLTECAWLMLNRSPDKYLMPGRRYTFPELKALYLAPQPYISLYHALKSDSQDYRLKVFQQLRKRKLLARDMEERDVAMLAQYLDQKPLYDWLQDDFDHIRGLTASDGLQMLIHLEQLRHLVFSMEDRKDVLLALRNLDILDQFESMNDLRKNIVRMDQDWRSLSEAMKLNQEFLALFEENILSFICENGAAIAETYREALDSSKQEAFFRVIKAELMGQLDELKYFEGDLQREIDFPLTNRIKTGWKRNLTMEQNGLEVGEYDDFFSTMLLGAQPYSTCLNYSGGAYRECLLSSFDSNKKILYATLEGRIVGRAFLRLTKGRMMGSDETELPFTFVDLENVRESRQSHASNHEHLALFLERSYISRVNAKMQDQIMQSFVELAQRKAEELGAALVLSLDYRGNCGTSFAQTHFDIYISKSKAGMQYLDSLDGPATATNEGSYKTNTFLIQRRT